MKSNREIQMNGRYPEAIAQEAHLYAVRHGLSLNVLLCAAAAEYLARRRSGEVGPTPQLHYERGRPPRDAVRLADQLMRRDPRGRKLSPMLIREVAQRGEHAARPTITERRASRRRVLAKHQRDGRVAMRPSEDIAEVRQGSAYPAAVPALDGEPAALAF